MPSALWIHGDGDPYATGELRRLGIPALMVEAQGWTSQFVGPRDRMLQAPWDVVVCGLQNADALSRLDPRLSPPVIIEVDLACALTPGPMATTLHALSNRITTVVARSPRAAQWAERILGGAQALVTTIGDPAARSMELLAAGLRFGLPEPREATTNLPEDFDLWFAEPGDMVEADEVEGLKRWTDDRERVVIAPPAIRAWLAQSGLTFSGRDWSPQLLDRALARTSGNIFSGRPGFSQVRRRTLALRKSLTQGRLGPAESDLISPLHLPKTVGRDWAQLLDRVRRREPTEAPGSLLLFLDLVQDLDLALPVIDEALARDLPLRTVVSTWLQRRSPRVTMEITARGLTVETVTRDAVLTGVEPDLSGVGAVISPAESSHSAHERAHALFRIARARRVPTFSLQHGVENIGLSGAETDNEEVTLLSDHFFAWFPPDATPQQAPASVRPRLVHVGRPTLLTKPVTDLRATLSNFRSIAVVFENLHWDRYDRAWRNQFVADCLEFASLDPHRCVVLKPHHAGLWSTRHTHLFPQWPQNFVLADPTDPFWEPYTAPSLLQIADLVVTTPSTVALDAVQAHKPVAVAAYGLSAAAYAPLPLLHSLQDWLSFALGSRDAADAQRRADFLVKTAWGEHAEARIVDRISAAMQERRIARQSTDVGE